MAGLAQLTHRPEMDQSVSQSSLSFHLQELTHAQLIVPRPDGRFVIYSANFDMMNGLLAFLSDNCCGGNPCGPSTLTECASSEASA
jgi:ArsR family transcriptional regulator